MSTYESLRAQIEAHEAEEARLLAEVDALRARAEAADADADSDGAAVCGCGVCKRVLVDEDGLCVSCGVWPILVADRTSAEEVVGLREDVEAATARAEAAEQRAEAAEAELAQARADARVLVGFIVGLERRGWAEAELVPAGITDAEVRALAAAYDVAYRLPATEMIAVIRRALGGAA